MHKLLHRLLKVLRPRELRRAVAATAHFTNAVVFFQQVLQPLERLCGLFSGGLAVGCLCGFRGIVHHARHLLLAQHFEKLGPLFFHRGELFRQRFERFIELLFDIEQLRRSLALLPRKVAQRWARLRFSTPDLFDGAVKVLHDLALFFEQLLKAPRLFDHLSRSHDLLSLLHFLLHPLLSFAEPLLHFWNCLLHRFWRAVRKGVEFLAILKQLLSDFVRRLSKRRVHAENWEVFRDF